jgi:ankyrin repeat protein
MSDTYDYSKDSFPLNTSIRLFDKTNFVRLLKVEGVNINRQDEFGETPISTLIMEDIADIRWIRILLKKGADVNILDSDGDSPLDLAKYKNREDIIELLIKYGAKCKDGVSVKQRNWDIYCDDTRVVNFVKSISRNSSN